MKKTGSLYKPNRHGSISDFDYSVKCIVIGNSGVGKTCLLQRLENGKRAMESKPTVDGVFHKKTCVTDDAALQLSIWDTAGSEVFRSITRIFYRGAACAFVVYSMTQRHSFNSVSVWLEDIKENCNNSKIILILIANKSDLIAEREVSKEEGLKFAKQHNMEYLETSAFNIEDVENVFMTASKLVYHHIKIGSLVPNTQVNGIKLGGSRTTCLSDGVKKSGCCT